MFLHEVVCCVIPVSVDKGQMLSSDLRDWTCEGSDVAGTQASGPPAPYAHMGGPGAGG